MKRNICVIFLALGAAFSLPPPALSSSWNSINSTKVFTNNYYRTELYLGRSKPGGGIVTDDEWDAFLKDVVTPRFPDGFTIMQATGQYREKNGKIDKEQSEVLVFLYSQTQRTASSRKIEEIRRAYVKQFDQESVLRLDFRQPVSVKF